jgi:hypothetical protein
MITGVVGLRRWLVASAVASTTLLPAVTSLAAPQARAPTFPSRPAVAGWLWSGIAA